MFNLVITDKLKPLVLVFLLIVVSQPVFAYITPCSMAEMEMEDVHSGHEMHHASDMNHMMTMEKDAHEQEAATSIEALSNCCGQVNCELMHCSAFTGVLATLHFSVNPLHSGINPGDSLVPVVADLAVSTPPPIFR